MKKRDKEIISKYQRLTQEKQKMLNDMLNGDYVFHTVESISKIINGYDSILKELRKKITFGNPK